MKLQPSHIKTIGIFRALQLGDLLCAIPAIRSLRKAYPNAKIILIGLKWARSFAVRFDNYFDDFIEFPGYPGLPEQPFNAQSFHEFLGEMLAKKFDILLQMQGDGTIVNPMVELFGAKNVAGFKTDGHYAPDNGLFMPYPGYGHEIERHLKLMQFLGIKTEGTDLEFPLYEQDINDLKKLNLNLQSKKYVCIHPGSRGAWRQWPTEHFARLADYCSYYGLKVVITGTNDEREITQTVIDQMQTKPIDITGQTSLGAIAALIKHAALLISNCTGVSHIAAAFKTPSVVISMDGEPLRWGPLDKQMHRTINWLESPDFDLVLKETGEQLESLLIA